ncbi:hypothetical protein EDC01DRAFT_777949 [Geopyxis carbonaria]|nr:hypothetical protein EDC01DRAFT_777949 [Geopyxis carbonaria]
MCPKAVNTRFLLTALFVSLLATSNAASIHSGVHLHRRHAQEVAPPPADALQPILPAVVAPAIVEIPPNNAIVADPATAAGTTEPAPVTYDPITGLPVDTSTYAAGIAAPSESAAETTEGYASTTEAMTDSATSSSMEATSSSYSSESSSAASGYSTDNSTTSESSSSESSTDSSTATSTTESASASSSAASSSYAHHTAAAASSTSESNTTSDASTSEAPTTTRSWTMKVVSTATAPLIAASTPSSSSSIINDTATSTTTLATPTLYTPSTDLPPAVTIAPSGPPATTPMVQPIFTNPCFNATCSNPNSDMKYEQRVKIEVKDENLLDKVEAAFDSGAGGEVGVEMLSVVVGVGVGMGVGMWVF